MTILRVNCVDYLLKKLFYKLGLVVAKYPGYFVIVPIFVTIICITGFQRLHYEMDSEFLFSPENGASKMERAIVESYFKTNYSHRFNPTRITRPGRYAKIIVIPKQGDNMLTVAIWNELRLLDTIVKNISIAYGEPGKTFYYQDMCARWMGDCFENDVLNLDVVMEQVESHQLNLTFPVMINPATWDAHTFPAFFGRIKRRDDVIEKVPSVQLMYFIADDTRQDDEKGALWEDKFIEQIGKAENGNVFQHISTARYASRTLDIELEKNTLSVIPYFLSTGIVMVLFAVVTSMMTDWVRSKPMLGLLGNISAAMGTLAAFGLAMYLGVDFIGINLAAPFLTCSIGIDDTFVMLAAWRRTPVTMNVPERTANMLSEAAVSITITSLTDIVSLFIGNNSPFPAIKIFSIYTGLAVTFILLWHLTFFTACVAIYGYLEQKNIHSVTCLPVLPASLAHDRSWFYRVFCTGGINTKDPDNFEDNPENVVMAWFRDGLGNALNKWPIKLLVILVFLGYLAGAGYGVSKVQEGLQRKKLSKPDSYSVEFYEREDYYFREYPYRIQVVISGDLHYWQPSLQNEIENLTRAFEQSAYVASSSFYTESWLRSFLGYVGRNKENMNITVDTKETFMKSLKELWLFPSNMFSLDVKFDETESKIIASRFIVQAVNITDGNVEKDMVSDLRRIARESKFNVTVYHPYFVFFDQFELVRPTSIQSMFSGGLMMMVITFLFIPNFICSFWVASMIISIEVGVVGYMALWDVNLDSISMVNLIMCIGFSVDFTAHICYAYMSSKAEESSGKTKESLFSLGLPVLQGAASTILGVGALLFVGSYIFLVFFKMIFLVTVIGALHGIFLLPVLLSLVGPGKRDKKPPPKAEPKRFSSPYCIPAYPTSPPPPPPPMTNIHHPKHFGIPLHGMVHDASMKFYCDKRKHEGHEKDLGLGTSEDSSDASSFESQKKQQENLQQRYIEGWRKSTSAQRNQFADEEQHWSNISMELLHRAKANYNAYHHHQRGYK